jgi:hypothetical protein
MMIVATTPATATADTIITNKTGTTMVVSGGLSGQSGTKE